MMGSTRQGERALVLPEAVKLDLAREEENLSAVFLERERRRVMLAEHALVLESKCLPFHDDPNTGRLSY
jgi:hypothetical protein